MSKDLGAGKSSTNNNIPTTRLFKILNPELFFSPKKIIYVPGTMIFAGIVGYFAYQSYFSTKDSNKSNEKNSVLAQKPSYLEKLETLNNK
ncbi:hypothetical protein BB561_001066 [Smittium simulii]|uniref:Uncharacterized protein n=1 Tax=Smittium simulii TaxID=133385 RepID=A0A2T9YW79_9FUNG|nr:hypothetical protein BB561_001066 [Smittium simulii]